MSKLQKKLCFGAFILIFTCALLRWPCSCSVRSLISSVTPFNRSSIKKHLQPSSLFASVRFYHDPSPPDISYLSGIHRTNIHKLKVITVSYSSLFRNEKFLLQPSIKIKLFHLAIFQITDCNFYLKLFFVIT